MKLEFEKRKIVINGENGGIGREIEEMLND